MNKRYRRRKFGLRKWQLIMLGGIAAVLALAVLYATKTFPFNKYEPAKPASTANSETKGEPQKPQDTGQSNQSSQDGSVPSHHKSPDEATNNTPDTSVKLKKPEGNFVNNHRPSLSSSNTMQSSCTTTAGAMCQIIFTKDSVTKALQAQKTDAGGGTYWTWTLQDLGLTAGTWRVQAKATLGSQIETTDDAVPLEIAP